MREVAQLFDSALDGDGAGEPLETLYAHCRIFCVTLSHVRPARLLDIVEADALASGQ